VKFTVHSYPKDIGSLMKQAHDAVTFFELCAVGISTIVFSPYGKRDVSSLEVIREHALTGVTFSMIIISLGLRTP
jgi:hypothetical protein